jgi:hypothetical protein
MAEHLGQLTGALANRVPNSVAVLCAALLLAAIAAPLAAQDGRPPAISQRQFKGGSAKVTVTGSFTIDQEIPINTQASIGDGESTWLQFGASGSAEPNILITYGETGETGIIAGKGKSSATGGITPGQESDCAGTVKVTPTLVSGEYTCRGLTSYEPGKGMGTVEVKVAFSATS